MLNITEICRDLRRNSTPAEKAFWLVVRNRQFKGFKFNRQYPIIFEYDDEKRFFVADFFCHELRLVVEIDGGIHETQKDYDTLRSAIISNLGFQIIRFPNTDVLKNTELVLGELERIIDGLTPDPFIKALTPNPSLHREGNIVSPLLSREKGPGDE